MWGGDGCQGRGREDEGGQGGRQLPPSSKLGKEDSKPLFVPCWWLGNPPWMMTDPDSGIHSVMEEADIQQGTLQTQVSTGHCQSLLGYRRSPWEESSPCHSWL